MMLKTRELIKAVCGKSVGVMDDFEITGISVDSRTIKKGEVFFAIRGERFDGHDFLDQAIERGGRFSVVERGELTKGVIVDDTRIALCRLARYYRKKFNTFTIAITGSNGKTTSKGLTHLVLEKKFDVLASPRSYNNEIGVPLTVFRLRVKNEILLLEFGMNNRGEISHLTEIAEPAIGVITNIAPVHIGNFSSTEQILKEKIQIAKTCSTIILNADDHMLNGVLERLSNKRILTFGIDGGDIRARDVYLSDSGSRFTVDDARFYLPLVGKHNIYNALVAIAIGDILGVERKRIVNALKKAAPEDGRDRLIKMDNFKIIDSTYNSNPVSLVSSIESMRLLRGRKIAVLGDMLELGKDASRFHREIGKRLKELGVEALFTYGELAKQIAEETEIAHISSYNDLSKLLFDLKEFIEDGDVVLVKGSRKMGMERIIEGLTEKRDAL